ncbi:MAG TPA: transposase [Spirochaetota bacterium]|mgnify:CR=1 FL=1|jgi:putative transposase|nr:MAG: hypothetical protein BWX91_01860 [Spirochaetes bacterium ADurb.Bin133]HNZ26638.1 transposase [Spirochaetota bacterium]HPY87448.1 transposase [Spirochaetota bacterium]
MAKISKEKNVFDELLDGIDFKNLTPEQITGPNGIINYLTKSILERALNAELTDELGCEKNQPKPSNVTNARNGSTPKTILLYFMTVKYA